MVTSNEVANAASVAVGALLLFSVGSAYSISAWNNQLRDALHLSQADISLLGASFTFGQYNSIWAGIFYDRFGVRWCATVAGLLLAGGYWTAALLPTGSPSWTLALCFGCIGLAHAFPAIAGLAANEGLYGNLHRGKILGFLVASYCAGGAAFAYVYNAWFDHDVMGYFNWLGWYMLAVCLIGIVFLHRSIPDGAAAAPFKSESPDELTPLVDRQVDVTLWELLATATFWYLFVPVMVGIGAAMFVMNNISFIVESNRGEMALVPFYVSLFSLCNLVGRFAMGALSDEFLASIPRSRFLSSSVVAIGITQLLFLVMPVAWIALPIATTGFAEGCIYGLFPVMTREYFGSKHFGKNYGLVSLSNAVGFPLVLGPLSTAVYHYHTLPGAVACDGASCFGPTFAFSAAASLLALYCSLQLR
ncbi:hypothetical protein AeNC1_005334 [Aphanomyces euteiches]|nr:hypothetical protein AeNC1_005334 [Aphanomyces euteiches]